MSCLEDLARAQYVFSIIDKVDYFELYEWVNIIKETKGIPDGVCVYCGKELKMYKLLCQEPFYIFNNKLGLPVYFSTCKLSLLEENLDQLLEWITE